jgi:ribosomal protein L40E
MEVDLGIRQEALVKKPKIKKDFLSQEIEVESVEAKIPPLKQENICPECGWILSLQAVKCPRCGAQIKEEKEVIDKFKLVKESLKEEKEVSDEEMREFLKPRPLETEIDLKSIDDALLRAKEAFTIKEKEELKAEDLSKPPEEVEKPEVEEIIETNKCLNCGWLLSSQATKCPRCGLEVKKE